MPVSFVSNVVAIAGGYSHSLALRSDGTVWAWGDNGSGELGNGTLDPSSTPKQVPGLTNVVAIAAPNDGYSSLALLADGTVRAWGSNSYGQIGNGTVATTGCVCVATPTKVLGLSRVVAIAAGNGFGVALLSDGTVRAWGYNEHRELGTSAVSTTGCMCIPTPARVSGVFNAMAIAAGDYSAMALRPNGAAVAWGWNDVGQLGRGFENNDTFTAGPVKGVSSAVALAAGYDFGIALLRSGGARAWGYAYNGQVGNGTTGDPSCSCVPTPAAVGALSNAIAIAAGAYHGLALLKNRTVMAWGNNDNGQLGNGNTSATGCKCVTAAAPVIALEGASAVVGGGYHSLALTGPVQRLNLRMAGAATGRVGGYGMLCAQACSQLFPQGAYAILRAAPSFGKRFAGFRGACVGTGPCRVRMNGDRTVVATFGPPKGTKITSANIKKTKGSAKFRFSAPGAVTGFECKLVKPVPKGKKNPKFRFSKCSTPRRYKDLKPGSYTFSVRARNIAGADPKPAKKEFKI